MQSKSESFGASGKGSVVPRLTRPVKITEQAWPEGTRPLVSVFNWTYNHAAFIRESIESILIQETTFPVEIIIHDDASNDGTTDVVREFEERHPQLFRNIIHRENQWSQGRSVMTPMFTAPRGEFLALAHGDDFWKEASKLEKQVEMLEKHSRCSGAFHRCAMTDQETGEVELLPAEGRMREGDLLGFSDVLKAYHFHTTSMMIRTDVCRLIGPDLAQAKIGDRTMQILAAQHGPWVFCEGVMSVFRRFPQSNFYHWDPRLLLPTFEAAANLDVSAADRRLAREVLADAYLGTASWRRAYNDAREARGLLFKALATDLQGLVRRHGVMPLAKQVMANLLNIGTKHPWADASRFARTRN